MNASNDAGQGPQEITVTCKQCGSTSMERLDRHEYRCNHCGSITVVSADEADNLEQALGQFLKDSRIQAQTRVSATAGKPASSASPHTARVKSTVRSARWFWVFLLVWFIAMLASFESRHEKANLTAATVSSGPKQVPSAGMLLSDLQQDGADMFYADLSNRTGQTVNVPEYEMDLYNGTQKAMSINSEAATKRLLPGERTPIRFKLPYEVESTRHQILRPETVEVDRSPIARLRLTHDQLVHERATKTYRLVGLLRNTTGNALQPGSIAVTLLGSNDNVLTWANGTLPNLPQGQEVPVDLKVELAEDKGPITAYEYLIDVTPYGR